MNFIIIQDENRNKQRISISNISKYTKFHGKSESIESTIFLKNGNVINCITSLSALDRAIQAMGGQIADLEEV